MTRIAIDFPNTPDKERSWLEAARDKYKRSSVPERRHESNLIIKVLAAQPIQDPLVIAEAAVVVAKAAPVGFTVDALRGWMTPCATGSNIGMIDEICREALGVVETVRAAVDDTDFEIDAKTLKPSSTSAKNYEIALRLMGMELSFDAFSRRKYVERDGVSEVVRDKHMLHIMFEIDKKHSFYPSKEKFLDYCSYRANLNTVHPPNEYFDEAQRRWDGQSRADTWLIDCAGAPDTPYVRAVSRLVLVAAVRRVRQPGCKFDEMMILEGPQGAMKSSAIKALCPKPEWFGDNLPLNADSKLIIERTAGKLIVEAPELRGMTAQDHNTLKMMLSTQCDESRMAYQRETEAVPRQFIIIGTTNDDAYLRDPTGARRYWPILIMQFDIAKLVDMRDQLWAEAAMLEATHPEESFIRLDPSLYEAAAEQQEKRRVVDSFEIVLAPLAEIRGIILNQDIWKLCGITDRRPTPVEMSRIGPIMKRFGWTVGRRRHNGAPTPCYERDAQPNQWLQVSIVGTDGYQVMPARTSPPAN